jgi:hypothetical protein
MKVLKFRHRKRLGLYQNDFGIDVLKFSTYVPRFCKTFKKLILNFSMNCCLLFIQARYSMVFRPV